MPFSNVLLKNFWVLFIFVLLANNHLLVAKFIKAEFIPIAESSIEIDIEADQVHKEQHLKEKTKKKFIESLDQQDIELLKEAFDQAPLKIKALVAGILNNEDYAKRFKHILLTGPSGSGKSILAEAISYQLGRKSIVIDAPSLLGHYRDQAAENIREAFRRMSEDPDKPVLIINEINALTDGHTSEHSDTKHTAMQLWTLLDKHKNDEDFFLIATTNVTKKMPHQLQTRFEGKTVLIDNPTTASRKRAIEFWLHRLKIEKDESCTDSYLSELATKADKFSLRTIAALIDYSLWLSAVKNPEMHCVKKVSKEYLDQAFLELSKQKEEFWDFSEHTTDEEKRHRENLAQNAKHAQESKELQIQIAEWNLIYQAQMKQFDRAATVHWRDALYSINKAKSIIFSDKMPAARVKTIPGKEGTGFFKTDATADTYELEKNSEK